MKSLLNKINLIGWTATVYAVSSGLSFTQTIDNTNASAVRPSEQIELQLSNYEAKVSIFETKIIQEPDKPFNESSHEQGLALQPLKDAIISLRLSQPNMDRKGKASLWLKVLSAIDRHLDTNIPSVDISGFVHPPHGYKGKVGPWGMIQPDTNDGVNYAYYVATVKANKEKARRALLLNELKSLNDLEATPWAEECLRSSYTSSVDDKQEFEELLGQSWLSNTRKQSLGSLFNEVH